MPPMIRADERGSTKLSWLDSHHTFSFGEYYHPERTGFGVLRVINEDVVMPKSGFDVHRHRNMEIISYVLDGELDHSDSEGYCPTLKAGDVQLMSAGCGITHSEKNARADKKAHFLQIWVEPCQRNTKPEYQKTSLANLHADGEFTLLASPDGRDESLEIGQDLFLSRLKMENTLISGYPLEENRKVWVHSVKGCGQLNGHDLCAGDGVGLEDVEELEFINKDGWEVLVFEMAK